MGAKKKKKLHTFPYVSTRSMHVCIIYICRSVSSELSMVCKPAPQGSICRGGTARSTTIVLVYYPLDPACPGLGLAYGRDKTHIFLSCSLLFSLCSLPFSCCAHHPTLFNRHTYMCTYVLLLHMLHTMVYHTVLYCTVQVRGHRIGRLVTPPKLVIVAVVPAFRWGRGGGGGGTGGRECRLLGRVPGVRRPRQRLRCTWSSYLHEPRQLRRSSGHLRQRALGRRARVEVGPREGRGCGCGGRGGNFAAQHHHPEQPASADERGGANATGTVCTIVYLVSRYSSTTTE